MRVKIHSVNNGKKLKALILLCSIFFVLTIAALIVIFSNNSEEISYDNAYSDDWAMYNYGQTINDSQGIAGIDINIIPAWEISKNNQTVIVAVVDTGTDPACSVLKDRMLINANDPADGIDNDNNGYVDDTFGWNFLDENNIIYEDALYDYHGTYISTTIARVAGDSVSILPVKFMQSASGSIDDAVLAIEYAVSRGARIINCSWNVNEPNEALYNVMKENPDILFVCSAGNSNINLDTSSLYPCSYDLDNVINVMAIDNKGQMYRGSGYGKETVHIAAPGVSAKVIMPEDEETYIDGTSVAAAFVSGAAALMLSNNDGLSPKDIKQIIMSTAKKNSSLETLCITGGYLDIEACLLKC
jgi:subtilisin family serine protease